MNLAEVITERLDKATLSARQELKRDYNHASETGWANVCQRRLCLLRECPEKQGEASVSLLRKFEEANRQEDLVVEELKRAGIEVLDTGKNKEVFFIPDFKIAVELDAKIKIDGGDPIITEIKSCDPGFFRYVKTVHSGSDMLKSPSFYLHLYPPQLWTQMLARKESFAIWLFKDRSKGEKHIVETDFEREGMDYMARTFDRIDEVNKMVDRDTAPDAAPCDGCNRCSFNAFCFEGVQPGKENAEKVEIVQSEEMESLASRWRELKAKIDPVSKDIKEAEKIEKELKDLFKGRNVIIGDVSVRVKSRYQMKVYNIPEDIKDKYLSYAEISRMTIEDLGKAF